jgi:hypothetical protein
VICTLAEGWVDVLLRLSGRRNDEAAIAKSHTAAHFTAFVLLGLSDRGRAVGDDATSTEAKAAEMDLLDILIPIAEVFFRIVENLPGCLTMEVRGMGITRNDGGVIEEVDETASLLGEQNLLLGACNGGSSVEVEGFLELLTSL